MLKHCFKSLHFITFLNKRRKQHASENNSVLFIFLSRICFILKGVKSLDFQCKLVISQALFHIRGRARIEYPFQLLNYRTKSLQIINMQIQQLDRMLK